MNKLIIYLLTLLVAIPSMSNGQNSPYDPYHKLHLDRLKKSLTYKLNIQETYENGHDNTELPEAGKVQYLRTIVNYIGKSADNCVSLNHDVTRQFQLDRITHRLFYDINEALDLANTQIQLYRSDKDVNNYLKIPGGKFWNIPGIPSVMDIDPTTNLPSLPSQGIIKDITKHTPTDKFLNIFVVDEILLGGLTSEIEATAYNKIVVNQSSDQDLASIIIASRYIDPDSPVYDPSVVIRVIGEYLGLLPTYSGSEDGDCPPEVDQVILNPLAALDPYYGDGIISTESMPDNLSSCYENNHCVNATVKYETAQNYMASLSCATNFTTEQTKIMHRYINEYLSGVIFGRSFIDENALFDDCTDGAIVQQFDILVYDEGIPLLLNGVTKLTMDIIEYEWAGESSPTQRANYTRVYDFPVPLTGVFFHKYKWLEGYADPKFFVTYEIKAVGFCGSQTITSNEQVGQDQLYIPSCADQFLFLENYEEGKDMNMKPPLFRRTKNMKSGKLAMDGINQTKYNFGPFFDHYEMDSFDVSDGIVTIASTSQGKYGNFYGNEAGDVVNVSMYGSANIKNSSLSLGELDITTGELLVGENAILTLEDVVTEVHTSSKLKIEDSGKLIINGENSMNFTSSNGATVEISNGGTLEFLDGSSLDIQGIGNVNIEGKLIIPDNALTTINIGPNVNLDLSGILEVGNNARLTLTGSGSVNLSQNNLDLGTNGNLSIYGNGNGSNITTNVASNIDITNVGSLWLRNVDLNLSNSAYINTNGSFRLDVCNVTSSGNVNLSGATEKIMLYGQANTRIVGSNFNDIKNPLIIINNYASSGANTIKIANNNFINCNVPIQSYGKGLNLVGNNFIVQNQDYFGVSQYNSSIPSNLSNNLFTGHYFAVESAGSNTGGLNVFNNQFKNNHQSIVASNEDVVLKCTDIESGLPYINQSIDFTPSMPPTFQYSNEIDRDAGISLSNCQLDIGNDKLNNFTNLEYAIRADQSKSIFINEGGNIFHNPGYAIVGKLKQAYDRYYNTVNGYVIDGFKNIIPTTYQVFDVKKPIDVNVVQLETSFGDEIKLRTDNLPSFATCGGDGIKNPIEIDAVLRIIQEGIFDAVTLKSNNTPATALFEQAMNQISTIEEKRNSVSGINKLLSILEAGQSSVDISSIESYFLQLVYDELLKSYGLGAYHQEITLNRGDRNTNIDELLERILNYIDVKIQSTINPLEIDELNLDKSVLLGIGQYFNKANNLLNSLSWPDDNTAITVNQLICRNTLADLFWNQEISNIEFTEGLIDCAQHLNLKKARVAPLHSDNLISTEKINQKNNELSVYPTVLGENNKIVIMEGLGQTIQEISIYNILGESLISNVDIDGIGSTTANINVSNLTSGVYFIYGKSHNSETVQKIIIQ